MELIYTCAFGLTGSRNIDYFKTHSCKHVELVNVRLNKRIIYMKKIFDSDWSQAVELLCNLVQKCVNPCRNFKFRAIKISNHIYERIT